MIMEMLIAGLVVFVASVLQGMFGFAFVLIGMPLLSLFMSIKFVAPLIALFLPLITGLLTFRFRSHFEYRKMLPLIAGTALGIPLGVFFLMEFSDKAVKTTLGVFLIIYASYSLLTKRAPFRFPPWSAYILGFVGGTLGGVFNTTGPTAVLYISSQDWAKINIVASLNFFIFIASVMVFLVHLISGNFTGEIFTSFIVLIPAMLAGMLVGVRGNRRFSEEKYRKSLFAVLMVMGVLLVY